MYDVILDCYTDEPAGFGTPPYLSVHSRYLAGTLESLNHEYYYITIDDLRYCKGENLELENNFNKRVINTTKNKRDTTNILENCNSILVVMGCFVEYEYISAEPPSFKEIEKHLLEYKEKKIILFYALGGDILPDSVTKDILSEEIFDEVYYGNVYNYYYAKADKFKPNYNLLAEIAPLSALVLNQIERPLIMEVETSTGCNRNPGCLFCIESIRGLPLEFRDPIDIIKEVKELYKNGMRYLRLGKQPNFYAYMNSKSNVIKKLLEGIRKCCPDLKMLHIDNVSPHDVPNKNGERITKLIVEFCTSGNIAPFGVESFDKNVRTACNLNGTISDIFDSLRIINKFGAKRGKDGFPMYLPGINIIYGLPGQTAETLNINLVNLRTILDSALLVRRIFVRKLTSPYGEQFDQNGDVEDSELQVWQSEINNQFALPMLKKVFPIDLELKGLRMEMYKNGNSILRKMGTCPVRVAIKDNKLILDEFYDVKIRGYLGNRTILGELI